MPGIAELWWKLRALVQGDMDAASPSPDQASSPRVLTGCNVPLAKGLMSQPLAP